MTLPGPAAERRSSSQQETLLLILAARAGAGLLDDAPSAVRDLLAGGLNWSRLLWVAHRQAMLPALHALLEEVEPDLVPAAIREQLRAHHEGNRHRMEVLLEHGRSAVELLEGQGIPAMGLRMLALIERVYGDPGLREYEPLDILVHPAQVERARSLLLNNGYQAVFPISAKRERALRRSRSFVPVHDHEQNIRLHLHDRVMPAFFSLGPEEAGIWDRRRPLAAAGGQVDVPADEDLLLLLCAYGTLHLWAELPWIEDVGRLITAAPGLDWLSVLERARTVGAGRMLLLGLHLTNDLLGAPLPEDARHAISTDLAVPDCAADVKTRLFSDREARMSEMRRMRFRLAMRERRSDRIRYLLNFASTPNVEDWKAVNLPEPVFPLYYGLRPLRLAAELVATRLGRGKNAPYYPTPMPLVDRMLAMAEIGPDDVVYDLGCGDGRIIINAALRYGARGVGVDFDAKLIAECNAAAREAGVEHLVTFIESDVMKIDLRPATVIMVWLLPNQHLALRPKLERELRPGARIVGHSFDMGDWIPTKTEVVEVPFYREESTIAYLWTVGEGHEGQPA